MPPFFTSGSPKMSWFSSRMRGSRAGPRGSRTKESDGRGGRTLRIAQVLARGRARRSSECGRARESHAEAGTGEDAGRKYVRERVFQPNHRCSVQRLKLASKREQERDTRLQTRKTTQTNMYVGLGRKLLLLQVHGFASGYNRIRASDGALSLARSKEQGDGREKKVDPLGREHTGV